MVRRSLVLLLFVVPAFGQTQQPAPTPAPPAPSSTTFSVPQQVRRVDPPSATATPEELERRADELRELKFYTDSMDYYEAAMRKGGSVSLLSNKHGIAALGLMRYDVAKKDFERALKNDKQYAEAYNNLGVVYYIRKNLKRAIREYELAIKLRDTSASFHSNLGTAYFTHKDVEKAIVEYQRALAIDPDVFEHRNTGGVALQLISAEERAKHDFTMAKLFARALVTTGNAGYADRSLIYLRKALEEGYDKIDSVYKDAEFAALRKDPRFTELMASRPPAIPQ